MYNKIRLKSSPCETTNGVGTIRDYDSWFDGFSVNGTVYRVGDGYNTCGVSKTNGSYLYETDYLKPVNWGYNALFCGKKDDAWHRERQAEGDIYWDSLFCK